MTSPNSAIWVSSSRRTVACSTCAGESLDEAERERMVAEVRAAYRFNSDVFVDMKKANEARKA